MNINDATAVYMGATEVTKLYLGATEAWNAIPPVPVVIQSVDTGHTFYPYVGGATTINTSITGVTAGSSLIFVIIGDCEAGSFAHSLTDPVGSTWNKLLEHVVVAWGGNDRTGETIYFAENVDAGDHPFTITGFTGGLMGIAILEVLNVSGIVASGVAGVASDSGGPPTAMNVTSSGNVPAGETLVLGIGVFTASVPNPGVINGTGGWTDRHVGGHEHIGGLVQSTTLFSDGSSPVTWTANRPTGGGPTKGWVSAVVAFQ